MLPLPATALLVCYCACPDADTASRIAQALVDERLAACVNVLPGVHSVYRWQDTVEHAGEVLLLIKTRGEHLQAVSARIQALHPYELPEVLAVEVAGGSQPYLDWIVAQTASTHTLLELE